jgi:hypothetical protein
VLTIGACRSMSSATFSGNTGKRALPVRPNQLNTPVVATFLPNFDVLISDQGNRRVIEVTVWNEIVWQYGQTGVAGCEAESRGCRSCRCPTRRAVRRLHPLRFFLPFRLWRIFRPCCRRVEAGLSCFCRLLALGRLACFLVSEDRYR